MLEILISNLFYLSYFSFSVKHPNLSKMTPAFVHATTPIVLVSVEVYHYVVPVSWSSFRDCELICCFWLNFVSFRVVRVFPIRVYFCDEHAWKYFEKFFFCDPKYSVIWVVWVICMNLFNDWRSPVRWWIFPGAVEISIFHPWISQTVQSYFVVRINAHFF